MEEQKATSFFRFEDLRIYTKALEYYKQLCNIVKTSDDFSQKTILLPMLDAAARISINIAEGSAAPKTQFIEYLKSAKSNVRQCVVFTTIALDNGFLSQQQADVSREALIEMTKMIGSMVLSLQKNSKESKTPHRNRVQNNNVSEIELQEDDYQSNLSSSSDLQSDLNFNY